MTDYTRIRTYGYPIVAAAESASCGCAAVNETSSCGCATTESASCSCAAANTAITTNIYTRASSRAESRNINNTEGCTCCKASMRDALRLLCCNAVSDLVDFDAFAFLTDFNMVGATPAVMPEDANDNLTDLSGTFRRFSPCNCDMIDIAGTVMTPFGSTVDVDEASLCSLSAIVFQLLPAPTPDPATAYCIADTDLTRYRQVRDLLQSELSTTCRSYGQCACQCDCTDDCCCAAGVLNALSNTSLNNRTTLVAGLLSLRNVTALGTIGNVLVLGSEENSRFYFVCANKVEFLA